MNWSSKTIAVKSIEADGNIEFRRKLPNVAELAASIGALGREPIHPLTVVKKGRAYRLVAGRDRFAALLNLGYKDVPVRVAENPTAEDLVAIERDENARRRPLTPDEVAQVELAVIEDLQERKPGRVPALQTVKAERRKVQAAAEGVKPATIRKREQRAEAREEGAAPQGPANASTDVAAPGPVAGGASKPRPATAPPPPIEMHGRVMPERYAQQAAHVHASLLKVAKAVETATAALHDLQGMRGPFETWKAQEWRQLLAQLVRLDIGAKRLMPAHACLCCEDNEGGCSLCRDERTLTAEEWAALPVNEREPEVYAAGLDAEPLHMTNLAEVAAGAKANGTGIHAKVKREIHVNGKPLSEYATELDEDEVPA